MAITISDRVGKAMEILRDGLRPFVERELERKYGAKWDGEVKKALSDRRLGQKGQDSLNDVAVLLVVMDKTWGPVFSSILGKAERGLVLELVEVRNRWAHQHKFSSDDAYRVFDSAGRLLQAVSAPEAQDLEGIKNELLRLRFDEQVRFERRKSVGTTIQSERAAQLPAWRDIVTPHPDVASGRYQQAEFAADLWQVYIGEGTDEYRDPAEFFRRTFLTESLKRLLVGAVERTSGKGGDPVVQLQTNFGGGKTHSMLALYHLVSGTHPGELSGVDALLAEADVQEIPKTKRVVLVGNKISPGNPVKKSDGTVVRTLWGELAWQLGGKKAFQRVEEDDKKATSPGDTLRELFKEYGPCLILIDEWVAYARQLHDDPDLPAGSFETQFTFAQALTESARAVNNCMLVVSLPASDTATSPHAQADDVEVGGVRGREALDRLRNVVGRLESSWRPASAEEGFEIVRRRLFQSLSDQDKFKQRDLIAKEFSDLYRKEAEHFPPEAKTVDYEKRIKAAFPIHPEIFDRLYTDWSTLVKFQRTRGVLRLMAAVIHSLWEKGDKNPLILPSMIPVDDPRVQFELTRYLSDAWIPVIEKDVDGSNSLPLRIDQMPNFGKVQAARRVARTIYLGSAPTADAAHRGIEDRQVNLGCVMPGESTSVFGDALRRLAGAATYLYQDGTRVWYSTQPTVTKLAEDRTEQLKRDKDKIQGEIETRVKHNTRTTGDFSRIHVFPGGGGDVPDDMDARLVVLGIDHPHTKENDSPAIEEAQAIMASRGSAPRNFPNTLLFVAPDKTGLQDLEDAAGRFLAWNSILADRDGLNLDPHQVRQAENQLGIARDTVEARVPETFRWLLVPTQKDPNAKMTWESTRLAGDKSFAVTASKKLQTSGNLITKWAPSLLRMELDRVPLWPNGHVSIKTLADYFATYLYLPRLLDSHVLLDAIKDGVALLSWEKDGFAYADSYDEEEGRYRGLRKAVQISIVGVQDPGVLVSPEAAQKQIAVEEAERAGAESSPAGENEPRSTETEETATGVSTGDRTTPPSRPKPKRYHGSVILDSERVGRDAGKVADEVISHLKGLVKSKVKVILEIEAEVPDGVPENVERTVRENSNTLKFESYGFEEE